MHLHAVFVWVAKQRWHIKRVITSKNQGKPNGYTAPHFTQRISHPCLPPAKGVGWGEWRGNPSFSATSERTHRSYLWVFHLCQWVDQRKKNNIPSCAEVANELVVDRDTLLDDAVFLCGLVNLHIVDQGRHDMSVRFFNVRVLPPQTGA